MTATPHGPPGSPPPTPPLKTAKRLGIAATMLVTGLAIWFDPRGNRLPEASYALFALAGVVVASALRARAVAGRERRMLEDLEARWTEIAAAVQAAERKGDSPVRALRALGITGPAARKIILQKLHGDTPAARPEGAARQNTSPSASILRNYTEGNGPSPTRPWSML